jgi:hypothetical protein
LEADIIFDSNGLLTASVSHIPGSNAITLNAAGVYLVIFSVSGVEPSQFAAFLGGVLIPGSIYGSGAGTQITTGQIIFSAAAGSILTITNHTSAAAVTLQSLAGGTQANSNASVTIIKLA